MSTRFQRLLIDGSHVISAVSWVGILAVAAAIFLPAIYAFAVEHGAVILAVSIAAGIVAKIVRWRIGG